MPLLSICSPSSFSWITQAKYMCVCQFTVDDLKPPSQFMANKFYPHFLMSVFLHAYLINA